MYSNIILYNANENRLSSINRRVELTENNDILEKQEYAKCKHNEWLVLRWNRFLVTKNVLQELKAKMK